MFAPPIQPDESLLKAVDELPLVARHLVDGFLQGQHRSALRGVGQEFVAYRPYMQGDALKDVDWKVWARSDHWFVRQYRHETNFRGTIFLDTSRSMDFGEGATNKFLYGRMLAACLALLMRTQLDAPGLVLAGGEGGAEVFLPSTRADHMDVLLGALGGATASSTATGFGDVEALASQCRSRSMAVVISDGLFDPEEMRRLLENLRLRDIDVLFFHLLSPEEMRPKYSGEWLLEDSETGREIVVDGAEMVRDYAPRLDAFLHTIEDMCLTLEADYCRITTDEPLDHALFHFLGRRVASGTA
jgi:uncharacterized protein (DUF58 family)